MFLIGLTGGIASGKSTVSAIFAKEFGVPVIDADLISRKVVEPNTTGWKRLVKTFGFSILNEDSTLNRDKLAEIIFNDSSKRRQLNKCLHGLIAFEMIKQIFFYLIKGSRYVILDVPLLFEIKMGLAFISYKVVVYCDSEEEQIRRLRLRNPELNEIDAKKRIDAQLNVKDRIKMADYCIDNSKDVEYTRRQIRNLNNIFRNSKKYLFIRLTLIFLASLAPLSLIFFYFN